MSISAPLLETLAILPSRESVKPREAPLLFSRENIGQNFCESTTEPFLSKFLSHPPQHNHRRPPGTTMTKADREPTDVS